MSFTFVSNEEPNLKALNSIISNWNELPVSDEQKKPIKMQDKEYPILPLLKKYLKSAGKHGLVQTTYFYSETHCPEVPGRQFAKGGGSMQGFKRWIRHTISPGYHDYDKVNCHPTAFVQYCQKKGWDVEPFESYLVKRDQYLSEMMTANNINRDAAKEVVLSILNGGVKAYNELEVKPAWLTFYKISVEEIQKKMMADPENAELVKRVKEVKKKNIGGSVMNRILCDIENKSLMTAIDFLRVKNPVLCFDGFMSKELYTQEQLDEMSEHVKEKTGYSFKWLEKKMDEGIDLSGFSVNEEQEDDSEKDTPAVKLDQLMASKGDYIKKIGSKIYAYEEETGIWSSDSFGIFARICGKFFGKTSETGGRPRNIRDMYTMAQTLPDSSDFFARGIQARKGKVLYKNGVKNIETANLEPFNHNYFFTKRIPRDFNPDKNETMIQKVMNTIFLDPLGEQIGVDYIRALGIAMTGRNPYEAQYDNLGTGSNGKSLMSQCMIDAFPGYVDSFNITSMRVNKYAAGNEHSDSKVKMSDTRIGFSSEASAEMVVDSEQFKRLCTQEGFYARECGEKEVKVKPEMTLFSLGQQPLVFDKIDKAVQRRRRGFPWNKTYEKVLDGSLDFLQTEEAYQALDHIIQWGYDEWVKDKASFLQIEELRLFREDLNEEQDVFGDLLERTYTIVADKENKENWIKSSEVYRAFRELKFSDFVITGKFKALGVERVKARGKDGNASYFKGLVKVSLTFSDDN